MTEAERAQRPRASHVQVTSPTPFTEAGLQQVDPQPEPLTARLRHKSGIAPAGAMTRSERHQRPVIQIQQHVRQILAIRPLQLERRAALGRDQTQPDRAHTGGCGFGLVQHL